MHDRAARRWIVAIVVVGAALRLAWVLLTAREPVGQDGGPDPFFYFTSALGIADGDGYRRVGIETAYFPPGYSYALAALFWLVAHTPLPDDPAAFAGAFNWILSVASIWLVYLLARRVLDERAGLVAAGIWAVLPGPIFYAGAFLSETLFLFLVLAALVVLTAEGRPGGEVSAARVAGFGAVAGLAALTRPVGLVMLPALLVAGWAAWGRRRALVHTAVAVLAACVVIAPWTVRNAVVMDAFIPISTNGGDDLCIGHNPRATGAFNFPRYCFGPLLVDPDREEVIRSKDNTKRALRYAWRHPGREPKLLVDRVRHMWDGDHEGLLAVESYGFDRFLDRDVRSVLATVADVMYFVVLALGLVGLVRLARRSPSGLVVLLTLAGFALAPLAFFGNPRFHEPALPLLAISAAASATAAARRYAA